MSYVVPRTLVNRAGVSYDALKTSVIFAEDMNKLKDNDIYLKEQTDAFNALEKREVLTANRTYYVRTDGNDLNNGLANTSGGAFLTIQKAVDIVSGLDIKGYSIVIQVADGTYTTPVNLKNVTGFAIPGNLIIKGNITTPTNVIISTTSNNCITANNLNVCWDIKDLKLQTTTSGDALFVDNGTILRFGNLVFHTTVGRHIYSSNNSFVQCIGNYAISGGALIHFKCNTGIINIIAYTITITNTPNFSYVYADIGFAGVVLCHACTFSGSATGKRYDISLNGVIYTGGASTYLPGNVAGTVVTGGQYA